MDCKWKGNPPKSQPRHRHTLIETETAPHSIEIEIPEFDTDLLLLKTNDNQGYNVRIYTYRLSTEAEETAKLSTT